MLNALTCMMMPYKEILYRRQTYKNPYYSRAKQSGYEITKEKV
jgi:hypothetical protein